MDLRRCFTARNVILRLVVVAMPLFVNCIATTEQVRQPMPILNGRDLATGLSDPTITVLVILSSIWITEDDWSGLGQLPVLLERNVTITTSPEQQNAGDLIVLDGGFVKKKVQLAPGVVLTISGGVMLTRYREDMPSSTPGIDLLANSEPSPNPPLLFLHRMAVKNRICFPAAWSTKSVEATPRPAIWPGKQNMTSDLDQTGCVNDTLVNPLQRCWTVRRRYNDIGTPGGVFGPMGRREPTNYLVRVIDVELLCSDVMPTDCVERLQPLGCYMSLFPKTPQQLPASASESTLPLRDTAALPMAENNTECSSRTIAISVGVVGSVAAVASLGALAAGLLRRRSRRRGGPGDANSPSLAPCDTTPPSVAPQPPSKHLPLGEGSGATAPGKADASLSTAPDDLHDHPTGSAASAAAAAGGGAGSNWEDPNLPITLATPTRKDLHVLSGDAVGPENQVTLLDKPPRGVGTFGRVMEGVYQGQPVAVKVVLEVHQCGGPGESLLRSFAQEVEILGRCCHPNVVRLLAASLTPPRMCLVMELLDASLLDRLYKPPAALIPLNTVLHIGLEVARGLEYLHPTIVHRDLKPANVLLKDPWGDRPLVKLADFGLSRLRSTFVPTTKPHAGTPAYLAPEGFESPDGIITHKADIYSFAILMWEMLSGERPWSGLNIMQLAISVRLNGCRPALFSLPPGRCPGKLTTLLRQCWDGDPMRRPAAAEVFKVLALIMQELAAGGEPQPTDSGPLECLGSGASDEAQDDGEDSAQRFQHYEQAPSPRMAMESASRPHPGDARGPPPEEPDGSGSLTQGDLAPLLDTHSTLGGSTPVVA